jgi:tRNA (guanine-N7-)-methyltransferase
MNTAPPIRYELMARTVPEGNVDLGSLVPGTGPIEIEIGFGRGRFLLERARAAPESRIIGLEIKAKWAHLVELRRVREELLNAVAFRADARAVLPRCGPDGSVMRVFIHFPDPWWKKRHAKRRVLDDDVLHHVARLLVKGGELFVQTDVEDRAASMRAQIEAHGGFELVHEAQNTYGARSNREVRADEDGLPVYRVLALRK